MFFLKYFLHYTEATRETFAFFLTFKRSIARLKKELFSYFQEKNKVFSEYTLSLAIMKCRFYNFYCGETILDKLLVVKY
jgi:hypothetical protein